MDTRTAGDHLTDEELFALALPPAGEPEAVPPHLVGCGRCGKALQDWKAAVRDVAREEVEPLRHRTPEEWRAAEERTIARLRREGGATRGRPLRWAVGLAAALLVALLLLPGNRAPRTPASAATSVSSASSELSAADADDDRLLRDVAKLSRGDDAGSLGALVPDPTVEAEEKL